MNAIINSGPREDSTRIGRAGTVRRQAVDVSPLRRVNQAIWLLCTGAREASFRNIKTIAECLADELINAAKVGLFSLSCSLFLSVCKPYYIKLRTKNFLLKYIEKKLLVCKISVFKIVSLFKIKLLTVMTAQCMGSRGFTWRH